MKKCNNCGKIVSEDTSFCPDCGSSIFDTAVNTPVDSSTQETVSSPFSTVETTPNSASAQSDSVRSAFEQPNQPLNNANPVVTQQPFTSVESVPIQNEQPLYGSAPVTQTATMTATVTNDKANVGLIILSVFIPLAGFILYFVKKKEEPKAAKSYGLAALIMFIVNIVLSVIITMCSTAGVLKLAKDVEKYSPDSSFSYSTNWNDDIDDADDASDNSTTTPAAPASSAKFASTKYAD